MTSRYTILIPNEDELRQPLQLAAAAHQYVTDGHIKCESSNVHHGSPFDSLVIWAEDGPENDSKVKHLAVYVAEVANVQHITVAKDGKNGRTWHMNNPHYNEGEGADDLALLHKIPFAGI
jgi:hypothetical protein